MEVDGISTYGEVDARGAETMVGVVVHYIDDGNESRDIASCFARKVGVDLPEVALATGSCNRFIHVTCATVVGGNGKLPVTENGV